MKLTAKQKTAIREEAIYKGEVEEAFKKLEETFKEVEKLRDRLNKIINEKGFTSPEAASASHAFDNKMNAYISLKNKK